MDISPWWALGAGLVGVVIGAVIGAVLGSVWSAKDFRRQARLDSYTKFVARSFRPLLTLPRLTPLLEAIRPLTLRTSETVRTTRCDSLPAKPEARSDEAVRSGGDRRRDEKGSGRRILYRSRQGHHQLVAELVVV
jgi:hypothetical protein